MTENAMPTDAKNAITHEVQPYVNMPKTTDRNPKLEALPSFPLSSTIAVEKFIRIALKSDIITFSITLIMTRYKPYVSIMTG